MNCSPADKGQIVDKKTTKVFFPEGKSWPLSWDCCRFFPAIYPSWSFAATPLSKLGFQAKVSPL